MLPFSSAPVAIPLKNMKIPRTAGWGERGTNTVPRNWTLIFGNVPLMCAQNTYYTIYNVMYDATNYII
jgi:hypothetical protein